jgi:hypothetical protein
MVESPLQTIGDTAPNDVSLSLTDPLEKKASPSAQARSKEEVMTNCGGTSLRERLHDAGPPTRGQKWYFYAERMVTIYPNIQFSALFFTTLATTLVVARLWVWTGGVATEYGRWKFDAEYDMFSLISKGELADKTLEIRQRLVKQINGFYGTVVFAILVGLVTASVNQIMMQFEAGAAKITMHDHTLLLGWNESTPRLVVQLALLRRAFQKQNATWARRLFWWTRIPPSSPCACNPIVIVDEQHTKEHMEAEIRFAFAKNGISPKRTKVGWDVVRARP